jgi:hypothetical protein
MTNNKLGKIGSIVTGISVSAFALAMIAGLGTTINMSAVCYFSCIFIAVGYIMFATAFTAPDKDKPITAAGLAGLLFAIIYAILVIIVYYAMLTTVRMNDTLGKETLSIISYEHLGSLFFNYDLLGYGFMGLSTFFIGFTITPNNKSESALRLLLWIHGIFFLSCLLMPMFPLFTPDMEGGDIIGTLVLLVWCMYFLPVCILGWNFFKRR